MWCERHDRMETPRMPRLVHAIASVHFVCKYDVTVINVVFFRETVEIFVAFEFFFSVARLFIVRKNLRVLVH